MPYIAGVGVSRLSSPREASLEQLVFRASAAALEDAGIARSDVDSLTLAASDQLDGRAISTMLLAAPAGGYLVDEIRCTEDGSLALAIAAQRVRSGVSRRALVVSWAKPSESPWEAAVGVNPEPVFTRPAGMHPLALEALEIQRFLTANRLGSAVFDELASARRRVAGRDGTATGDTPLATPLTAGHLPPPSDAAVAVLVTSEPSAVELAGMSYGVEHPIPSARTGPPGALLEAQSARAFDRAGVSGTRRCDLVETTDHNAFRLVMNVAGLGLASPAEALELLTVGELPQVNGDGGLWRSNPLTAAGLEVTARATRRLRDSGGVAVCHSSFGMAGNGQAAWVLRAVA